MFRPLCDILSSQSNNSLHYQSRADVFKDLTQTALISSWQHLCRQYLSQAVRTYQDSTYLNKTASNLLGKKIEKCFGSDTQSHEDKCDHVILQTHLCHLHLCVDTFQCTVFTYLQEVSQISRKSSRFSWSRACWSVMRCLHSCVAVRLPHDFLVNSVERKQNPFKWSRM